MPISPELRLQIQAWVAFTKAQGWYALDGPFLVTRNRTAMKPQYVEDALERVGQRVGLTRKLKPHTLRRTFGSHLLNKGPRLEVVSKLLGSRLDRDHREGLRAPRGRRPFAPRCSEALSA